MDYKPEPSGKRIVILGGGFGGAYCAKALEKQLQDGSCEVVVIDRHNYFVFYPLLIEAGTGGIEPRHAVIPVRPFLTKTHFYTGEIQSVDATAQKISYKLPATD